MRAETHPEHGQVIEPCALEQGLLRGLHVLRFANQVLCAIYILKHRGKLDNTVIGVVVIGSCFWVARDLSETTFPARLVVWELKRGQFQVVEIIGIVTHVINLAFQGEDYLTTKVTLFQAA